MPGEITIREAGPDDYRAIARVHVASWREAYEGLVPQSYLNRLNVRERTRRWQEIMTRLGDREKVFLGELNGEVLGVANFGPQRSPKLIADGEIFMIYVLRQAYGSGLGSALMRNVAIAMQALDYETVALWVLRRNGRARAFYESLGGEAIGIDNRLNMDGKWLVETAYFWPDLNELGQRAAVKEAMQARWG